MAMTLKSVLDGIEVVSLTGDPGTEVTGISYDSRTTRSGHLFVAMKGEHADGHRFIPGAIEKGAAAVLHDEDIPARSGARAVFVRVKDSRETLARAANNFYGRPSSTLTVIGITGTNGKTTTSYLVKSILETWGRKVGLIGTIQYLIGAEACAATHTTPEAPEFQMLLRKMLDAGCSHVVTEVSSHALAQRRVDATLFSGAVFTNLTRDHLDYHHSMEDYFSAKSRLFSELLAGSASSAINYDDPYGRRLASSLKGPVLTFGLESGADFMATDIKTSFTGLSFAITTPERRYGVSSRLVGLPNVYNILSAAAVTSSLGVPWEVILEGVKRTEPVKGRFETVEAGQKFLAVVDYAHTEDALERLIATARSLTTGRVIVVFGCGGDRDRGKRPTMGAIATRMADLAIITSDNPRSEDPAAIIREIEQGTGGKNYLIEQDRLEAIRRAVRSAGEGDVLLIAGKGHESYQEAGGKRSAFSDREALEAEIRRAAGAR